MSDMCTFIEFQFLIVQLKEEFYGQDVPVDLVSIPYSTIKRNPVPLAGLMYESFNSL